MRNTRWGDGIEQSMIFLDGDRDIDPELVSKPKGMKRLLQERGLWNANLKKQCGRQKKDKSKFDEMIVTEWPPADLRSPSIRRRNNHINGQKHNESGFV
jgi:hypothetical protein